LIKRTNNDFDLSEYLELMHLPKPNRFLPDYNLSEFKGKKREEYNDRPKLLHSSQKLTLYLVPDQVHLKPRLHIKMILMLSEEGLKFINNPKALALLRIMLDAVIETNNSTSGEEAELAGISSNSKIYVNNSGVWFKFRGYSGAKILSFVQIFFDQMIECAKLGGFSET